MQKFVLICAGLFVLALAVEPSAAFLRKFYQPNGTEAANEMWRDVGEEDEKHEALFLTPYIEAGKLEEGRKLSEVKGLPNILGKHEVKSFSGFLTVNKEHNSNIFFWFFPPMHGKVDKDTPVLLWLQGGPGASSLFGLFVENGPLQVTADGKHAFVREYFSWNTDYAVLYIDQPVGTGFSFTDSDKGYAKNEEDVARDLYEALKQFFTLYEDYRGNPFFVTGESYAGKYVPAIGYKIHKEGENARKHGIHLHGLAIGDGLCDPLHMFDYGDYLYQVGLIDDLQRDHFYLEQVKAAILIEKREFEKAFRVFDELLNGDLTPDGSSYFRNVTGLKNYFNILYQDIPESTGWYMTYLGMEKTRKAIHVGHRPYNDGSAVEKHLINDVMDSVLPWVEELLDADVRVLFYSGQLDVIVAAPLTENFLRRMHWKRSGEFNHSPRKIFHIGHDKFKYVAGYVREANNMYYAIIRNAGHMVPMDVPEVAYEMITRFVHKRSFE